MVAAHSPLRGSTRPRGAPRSSRNTNAALMVEPSDSVATLIPALRSQEKALLEPIEFGPATHLALEHVQAMLWPSTGPFLQGRVTPALTAA